jgi:hypothetical protein
MQIVCALDESVYCYIHWNKCCDGG